MTPDPSSLRKLAQALREQAINEEVTHIKQAYLVLKAVKGLEILREKVRGS